MSTYVVVWEFFVRPDKQAEFEFQYGAEGEWCRLFRKSSCYLKTELLKDTDLSNRYLTLDHWTSKHEYEEFKCAKQAEYAAIDLSCQEQTLSEKFIGGFVGLALA